MMINKNKDSTNTFADDKAEKNIENIKNKNCKKQSSYFPTQILEIVFQMGLMLGILTIVGAAILLFIAKDPTRTTVS